MVGEMIRYVMPRDWHEGRRQRSMGRDAGSVAARKTARSPMTGRRGASCRARSQGNHAEPARTSACLNLLSRLTVPDEIPRDCRACTTKPLRLAAVCGLSL
jgi:hypothetical protein